MIRSLTQNRPDRRRARAAALSLLYVTGLCLALFHIAFDDHHCHTHCAPESPAANSLLPGDHAPCGYLHHDLDDHRDLGNADPKAPMRGLAAAAVAVAAWDDPDPAPALLEAREIAARPLPVHAAAASPRAPPRLLAV